VGLGDRKGRIAPGLDADFVAWDPDGERVVDLTHLQQRHPITPYAQRKLSGAIHATILRGRTVYAAGSAEGPRTGRLLRRGKA